MNLTPFLLQSCPLERSYRNRISLSESNILHTNTIIKNPLSGSMRSMAVFTALASILVGR